MEGGSQIISILFYDKEKSYHESHLFSHHPQLRLFLEPGDSLKIGLDLNAYTTPKFEGDGIIENFVLNNLSKYQSYGYEQKSLELIRMNEEVVRRNQYRLSDDFLYYIDNEHTSLRLSFELDQLTDKMIRDINKKSAQSIDLVQNYSWHLNNSHGYKSPAYWMFLESFLGFVTTSHINFNENDKAEQIDSYFTAWDAEYLHAWNTLQNIETNGLLLNEFGSFPALERFRSSYPESSFTRILQNSLQKYQAFQTGQKVPRILRDVIAKQSLSNSSANNFAVSVLKQFSPKWIDQDIPLNTTHFIVIHEDLINRESIPIQKGNPNGIGHTIVVAATDSTLKLCEPIHNKTVFYQKNWQITGFTDIRNSKGLANYYSWPVKKVSQNRLISLSVLLYSLLAILILSGIIILSVRSYSIRKSRKLSYERKIHELELKAIRAKMNPHFLFNALSSIQSLINQNQLKRANDYLANFGELVRSFLNQSNMRTVTVAEELKVLETYMGLESLRFDFTFNIEIAKEIDIDVVELPPLLIQPHLENALLHGIGQSTIDGVISLQFSIVEAFLVILIQDNGVGFDAESTNNGNGKGWELTCQRIDFLKKETGLDYRVRRIDNSDNIIGAMVEFRLPIEQQ